MVFYHRVPNYFNILYQSFSRESIAQWSEEIVELLVLGQLTSLFYFRVQSTNIVDEDNLLKSLRNQLSSILYNKWSTLLFYLRMRNRVGSSPQVIFKVPTWKTSLFFKTPMSFFFGRKSKDTHCVSLGPRINSFGSTCQLFCIAG